MQREYHKWYSPSLHRDMELLVFGHGGARVLVFPTRMGRFYEYEDAGMVHALRPHLENGWLQLYCVDSIDGESIYCEWKHPRDRMIRHLEYENYILREVLPLTAVRNGNPYLIVHGCSLGAYHAVNIALRHPRLFNKVLAFSGRYDLSLPFTGFADLFGGYYDENIYFNTPCHYVPNLHDPETLDALRRLDLTLVVGDEDPFHENNRFLSGVLWGKGVWHAFHTWTGRAHTFKYWREMAKAFM